MASAEKALIEDADNVESSQGVNNNQEADISRRKDTKYSWFVCFCTFISQVFVLGVLHAFGVFFVEFLKEFNCPKGEAAWVGSLAYGLSMTFGPVTSILVSRFGYRRVMMVGGLICSASLVASSFATSIPLLFLTFSVFYGIGTCMCTSPTMTITTEYFDKYLSVATGITVSGSSFGTLIMGPLSQAIIDVGGWRTAFRIFAGLCLVTIVLNSRIRPLSKPQKRKGEHTLLSDLQIWKSRVFVVWVCSITLVMFGFYIPYVHLVSYAIESGVSPDMASLLMMILGATTAFGRIVFGKIVQYGILNRLHMHQLSMLITGTGVMLLPLIKSYTGIVLYVVTVGLVDGCFVVLLPIMTATLVGIEKSVLAWGFMIGTSSVTFTLGPPVAGALCDMTGSYNVAFHCAGVPIILGAILLFLIPWAQRTSNRENVLDIVTDYAVTDTNTHEMSDAVGKTDSGGTIWATTDVDGPRYRSVGTSPEHAYTVDRSTSPIDLPFRRMSLEVVDTLAQLSRADKVLGQMLNQTECSLVDPPSHLQQSQHGVEIPRLPPPSDPVRYKRAGHGRDSSHSQGNSSQSSVTSSFRERPSASSSQRHCLVSDSHHSGQDTVFMTEPGTIYSESNVNQQQNRHKTSAAFVPIMASAESSLISTLPIEQCLNVSITPEMHPLDMPFHQFSQLSQLSENSAHLSGVTSPALTSSWVSPRPVRPGSIAASQAESVTSNKHSPRLVRPGSTAASQSQSVISPKPETESFEQTISEQLTKILETLCNPSSMENNEDGAAARAISPRPDRSEPILVPLPIKCQTSALSARLDKQTTSESEIRLETPSYSDTNTEETAFFHDHEKTVTKGHNPFACDIPTTRPGGTAHLMSLFSESDNQVKAAPSAEAIESGSHTGVTQTKSQTSELDIFNHLFDDNGGEETK